MQEGEIHYKLLWTGNYFRNTIIEKHVKTKAHQQQDEEHRSL